MTVKIVNIGNVSGLAVSLALVVFLVFYGKFRNLAENLSHTAVGKAVVCGSVIIFAAVALTSAVISGFMIKEMHDEPKDNPVTLVVLGCQIHGRNPSLMLKRRLNTAYVYLSEHDDAKVIVSGGQGSDEITSEADVMYNYLVKRGIEAERIFLEDKSENTLENIRFSKQIMESENLCGNMTIVTDGFHQLRADMFAKREGLDPYNIPVNTAYWLLPTYWVREWFGLVYYFVFK